MVFQKKLKAFSLIELSIVMVIMSCTFGIVMTMKNNYDVDKLNKVTQSRMRSIEKSLSIFVNYNRRLPCPARINDDIYSNSLGISQGLGSVCSVAERVNGVAVGSVPVRTLGLDDEYLFDGWGKRFRYIMAENCNASDDTGDVHYNPTVNFKNCTSNIQIAELNGHIINDNIYIILSHGANSKGAFDMYGNKIQDSTNNQELINSNISQLFYISSLDNAFDDILLYGTMLKLVRLSKGTKASADIYNICPLAETLQDIGNVSDICNVTANPNCSNYMQVMAQNIVKKCF